MKKPIGQTRAMKHFAKPFRYPLHDELWYGKAKRGYAIGSGDLEIGIVDLDAMVPIASMEYARDICAAYNARKERPMGEQATQQTGLSKAQIKMILAVSSEPSAVEPHLSSLTPEMLVAGGSLLDAWISGELELRALSPSSLAAIVYSSMRSRAP